MLGVFWRLSHHRAMTHKATNHLNGQNLRFFRILWAEVEYRRLRLR